MCAAITADGKLAADGVDPGNFGPLPGNVWFAQSAEPLRRLFDENLVAEIRLLVRPTIDGRRGAATLSGLPGEYFPASIRLRLLSMEVRGGECVLHYRVRRPRAKRPAAA